MNVTMRTLAENTLMALSALWNKYVNPILHSHAKSLCHAAV
jgi:hypothetical protein